VSEGDPKSTRKRRVARQGAIGAVLLGVVVFLGWYFTSPQFHESMRRHLVSRLEEITGGRVELGRFEWNLSRLEFDVHDLTIHGLEAPGEIPYIHADRVLIDARIVSLFRRQIALDRVEVDRPVFHLIVYPDGHTNQPTPKAARENATTESLFDLAVAHAEFRNGQLLFNEDVIPVDATADELQLGMKYVAASHSYAGELKFKVQQAKYSKYLPANADIDMAFSLRSNELEVKGFHLVSGNSRMEASGKVVDFRNPVANVTYQGSFDGVQMARVLRLKEIRRGQADVRGELTYEKSLLASTGKLVVHNLEYRTAGLHLSSVDAAADYALDEKRLALTHLVSRVAGGIAKGDAVVNWAAASTTPGRRPAEQTGMVHLNVENASAAAVAQTFSTSEIQLTQLHAVGTGRGALKIQWRGNPSRSVVDMDVSVTPPETFAPSELPVRGELKGTYELSPQRLRAKTLQVTLPYLQLTANGTLGAVAENLNVSLGVSDLSRVGPLLTIVNEEGSKAGDMAGQMRFEGALSGKIAAPTIAGLVQLSDLTFPLAAIWTPPPPLEVVSTSVPHVARPKYIHMDSGRADIVYSAKGLTVRNGLVRRAGAQAKIDFSTELTNGEFTDASAVSLHMNIRDAAIADLQQIAGYNYPISGIVATDLNVHGTRLNLQGGGHVQLVNALVYGQTIQSASADVRFVNEEAQISNLMLVHDHAQVTGSGAYNLKSERYRFQAVGSNFELGTIPALNRNRVTMTGRLNFNASGSGTLDAPLINASAHLQNVVLNGQRVGDAKLLAVTQGDTLHLTARSNFQTAEVTLDGTIRMREMMPAHINAQFSNFDFMPLLQSVFHTKLSGQSYVGGTLTLEGPLKQPKTLTVHAQIPKLTAEMEGVELHNAEPIRVSVANQRVQLDSVHLVGTDTQFTATGTVDLIGNGKMDIRADGRLNLKLAQSFDPDINSGGFVDFNVSVGGTLSKPGIFGEVKVTNGAVSLIDFPNGLSNINGTLLFNEERIQVQSLTARTGGGDIRIGGFAAYYPGTSFNVTVQGEDVRMRYPQGVSTTANLNLKLIGNLNSSTLSGDVTITRFAFNNQFDIATFLAKANRPQETARVSPLNNVHFNLHVVSTPQLQVQSSLAKVAGNADLRVRGTPANPILLGRINITEGQVDFNGATYRIDRGDVSFLNPARTEPTIDVAATTRVRSYDITLRFSGQPSHGLKTNYSSDPPLPAADIINLLAFGQTREEAQIESNQGSTPMTESVSNAILGQAINNAVSSRMQKLFGVSRVKISPDVGSTQSNPTTQVTIEQQVSNKITVTYISNLTQSSQQAIFVEYTVDRNLSFIAGRDQYGVVSFDVRIRQRKR
jgi:translocation and assembly module TamB